MEVFPTSQRGVIDLPVHSPFPMFIHPMEPNVSSLPEYFDLGAISQLPDMQNQVMVLGKVITQRVLPNGQWEYREYIRASKIPANQQKVTTSVAEMPLLTSKGYHLSVNRRFAVYVTERFEEYELDHTIRAAELICPL